KRDEVDSFAAHAPRGDGGQRAVQQRAGAGRWAFGAGADADGAKRAVHRSLRFVTKEPAAPTEWEPRVRATVAAEGCVLGRDPSTGAPTSRAPGEHATTAGAHPHRREGVRHDDSGWFGLRTNENNHRGRGAGTSSGSCRTTGTYPRAAAPCR